MQDNIQNNWKTSLESPENFPAQTIRDKTKAWEKLYSRLHKKPRRKVVAWYWAAAAFLIMAIGALLIFAGKEKTQPVFVNVPSPVKKQTPVTTESALIVEQKNSQQLSTRQQKTHIVVSLRKNNLSKKTQPGNNSVMIDSIAKRPPDVVITPNIMYDSSIKTITVATPARKKLRLVHLNEIGQPTIEPTVNNRFAERHGFELKIINGGIYNPGNNSSSNNGLILSRSRNTSN